MRIVVLVAALLFIAAIGALTAVDISRHGLTVAAVLALLIELLFGVGILGALLGRPRR